MLFSRPCAVRIAAQFANLGPVLRYRLVRRPQSLLHPFRRGYRRLRRRVCRLCFFFQSFVRIRLINVVHSLPLSFVRASTCDPAFGTEFHRIKLCPRQGLVRLIRVRTGIYGDQLPALLTAMNHAPVTAAILFLNRIARLVELNAQRIPPGLLIRTSQPLPHPFQLCPCFVLVFCRFVLVLSDTSKRGSLFLIVRGRGGGIRGQTFVRFSAIAREGVIGVIPSHKVPCPVHEFFQQLV